MSIKLMMKKSKETFDYSKTQWGIAKIENYKSNFQGLELEILIKRLGKNTHKKLKVLDLGCGGGNVDGFLKSKFPHWDITGIDVSAKALEIARKNFPGVKFINQSVDKLKFKSKSFDLILSLDTLEHFDNPQKVVGSARDLLKSDGLFFLAIPTERQFPTFYWLMYKLGLDKEKRESVGHINVFNDRQVSDIFKNVGFIKEKQYFSGHAIYSILDFFCFWILRSDKRKTPSFESSLIIMKPGLKRTLLLGLKNIASILIYYESKIFSGIPGGRCHYFFRKSDFFSVNPPVTVCETLQIKHGLKKVMRPKDLFIKRHLESWKMEKSDSVLDFGCANGIWLERILKDGKTQGSGIDVSDKLIETAKFRKNVRGKYFLYDNIWPLKNNSFDYCFSFDVFEHIKDKEKEIKRIYIALKTGGRFLFYTLNPNNRYTFDWLFESLGSNYLYSRCNHDKKLFPNPKIFKRILENTGFKAVEYKLFDGPFNLFWDVFSYALLTVLPSEKVFLLNDKFVRFIYPINVFLDKIFNNHGYSNGYFIWGEK